MAELVYGCLLAMAQCTPNLLHPCLCFRNGSSKGARVYYCIRSTPNFKSGICIIIIDHASRPQSGPTKGQQGNRAYGPGCNCDPVPAKEPCKHSKNNTPELPRLRIPIQREPGSFIGNRTSQRFKTKWPRPDCQESSLGSQSVGNAGAEAKFWRKGGPEVLVDFCTSGKTLFKGLAMTTSKHLGIFTLYNNYLHPDARYLSSAMP